jgi:FkbM family methyltransferase
MKQIYSKLKERNITPTHVCEVGVYLPETSNIIDFIKDGIKATLVEADPATVEKIRTYFKGYDITLHPYAVWDHNGVIKLSKANASTFVTSLESSPAIENDKYKVKEEDTFEVPCRIFSDLDDGTIDLLSVDIEGSEWYVIKYLKSRPRIISIETHGKYYTNPFIKEITAWIEENNYTPWFKDGSDTVYVRKDVFMPNAADKKLARNAERKIKWKKFKRIFKKMVGK